MTDLQKIKDWISTYTGYDILGHMFVDYTDQLPSNGGIFPAGMLEIDRRADILGNTRIINQRNFGLYFLFTKSPGDDVGATINADWIEDFQNWVQEQAARHLVPTLGDRTTGAKAENGILLDADEEGTATYTVQLSITYEREIEV